MLGQCHTHIQLEVFDQIAKKPKLIATDTMNLWIDNCYDDLKNNKESRFINDQ